MSKRDLDSYGRNVRRVAAKSADDENVVAIQKRQFRASLVDNPLKRSTSIFSAIAASRLRKPK